MSRTSPPDWSQPLAHPIRLRSGVDLVTLRDAAELILNRLPQRVQLRPFWQYASELLMRAAQSRKAADRKEATHQMGRALAAEGWLIRP